MSTVSPGTFVPLYVSVSLCVCFWQRCSYSLFPIPSNLHGSPLHSFGGWRSLSYNWWVIDTIRLGYGKFQIWLIFALLAQGLLFHYMCQCVCFWQRCSYSPFPIPSNLHGSSLHSFGGQRSLSYDWWVIDTNRLGYRKFQIWLIFLPSHILVQDTR